VNAKTLAWLHSLWRDPSAVVGINRRNAELVYPNNERRDYRFADDKLLAKATLATAGLPVAPTLAVCDGLYAVAGTVQRLQSHDAFVVKPSRGSGGAGILVLSGRDGQGWTTPSGAQVGVDVLRKHLADIVFGAFGKQLGDVAFAEPLVIAHPTFRGLWSEGLCDLRVLTLWGVPFMAMLRIPMQASNGKANLHQGGIGAAIDLSTGRITRAVLRNRSIERHPESGAEIVGVQLPAWAQVVDVAKRAADAVPLGYLGVDIAVDEKEGPLILEVNLRPGLEIQNVHGEGIEQALRRVWP
jgi:alpha-L-glutamate ligase-like protein